MVRAIGLIVLVGCGRVGFAPLGDGAGGTADARTTCDPSAPFGTPMPVPGLDVPDVGFARLSADEREVFFHTFGGPNKINTAVRATTAAPFGPWQLLDFGDPAANDTGPSLSLDGLTIAFASNRLGGPNPDDLWSATRPTPQDPFGAPTPIANVDTATNENHPAIVGNNLALFYTTRISDENIYEARADPMGGFAAGAPVAAINSSSNETYAAPNTDGTVVYFGSNRGVADYDIYVITRATPGSAFGAPVAVAELNTIYKEEPNWISPDLCRLYFTKFDPVGTNPRVFVAERPL